MKNKASDLRTKRCAKQSLHDDVSTPCENCNNFDADNICLPCSDRRATKTIELAIFLPCLIMITTGFIAWSCYILYINVLLKYAPAILYGIIFFALGSYLGAQDVNSWSLQIGGSRELITVPRNYSTTVLLIMSVVLKLFWGYFYHSYLEIPNWIYIADMITSSIGTGFFTGRTTYFFKKYLNK